jgi:16S rRNA (cytosine1402-N4)-methyltransferase
MAMGERQPSPHRPVLYQEIIDSLAPVSPKRYLDCTAGAGGHTQGILEACSPLGQVLALDLDPQAVQLAKAATERFGKRVHIIHGSYLDAQAFVDELGWDGVDGIVMDLGVSSMQLDQAHRGFSFRYDAPLDMRFDPQQGLSASELLEQLSEKELADLLWRYGEEKYSRRIAKAIIAARPIQTTSQLAEIVRASLGRGAGIQDPATRTFQALRIAVNRELTTVEQALPDLIELLRPQGRIAVISFHSLEDRLVKQAFRLAASDCICPPEQPLCTCNHKASIKLLRPYFITPGQAELEENPRSRSAKLRVAEKLSGTESAGN